MLRRLIDTAAFFAALGLAAWAAETLCRLFGAA